MATAIGHAICATAATAPNAPVIATIGHTLNAVRDRRER
jgi:hypothetical protein